MICATEGVAAEGLARFPDDLPLPSRFDQVPAGFYLSPRQVRDMMEGEDGEWRLSAHQEERLRDLNLRAAAAKEARWKAEKLRWKEERRARKLAIWEREWERRGLKMRRPDWFMPGLNAHNLEKKRQKMELVKRCAGYLAALCGSDGYANMPGGYPAALRAVFGTARPYSSPTTLSDLRKQVFTLCRDFITARSEAAGGGTPEAENPSFSGGTPPRGYAGVLKRNKEKSIQRTIATRLSDVSGYSTRRASAKPDVRKGSDNAGAAPETLPVPEAPGASRGPRNIAWLPARLLPGKIVGLAVATLPKLEFRHGRHGCTVAWSRGHALNYLASGLAAGRPLAGLVDAYKSALGEEDFGTHSPGRTKRTPGRVIARARRAAYRLGIVAQWALDAYREKRDAKREGRERCRNFETAAKHAGAVFGPSLPVVNDVIGPVFMQRLDGPVIVPPPRRDPEKARAERIAALSALAQSAETQDSFDRLARELAALGHVMPVRDEAQDENAVMIAAAKTAVNSWDFDERARARRFLDGLGVSY